MEGPGSLPDCWERALTGFGLHARAYEPAALLRSMYVTVNASLYNLDWLNAEQNNRVLEVRVVVDHLWRLLALGPLTREAQLLCSQAPMRVCCMFNSKLLFGLALVNF